MPGTTAADHVDSIADLRMRVFAEFPYLYQGDLAYEKDYLKVYFESLRSIMILATTGDENELVGVSTAIVLADGDPEFQKPFVAAGYNLEQVMYFGESVLLPEYRGYGHGRKFMELREDFSTMFESVRFLSFCSVVREGHDPRKPANYHTKNKFWESCGFNKDSTLQTSYSWKDLGEESESEKNMEFWLKKLR
jgi:GNAT superfamily N-acetyltransferase